MAIPVWVTEVLNWVPLLLILAATLLCFINLQLSRRRLLLTFGFFGLALAELGVRYLQTLAREQRPVDIAMYFSIAFLVRLVCWGLIVGGLAAVFADLRDRVDVSPRDETSTPGR